MDTLEDKPLNLRLTEAEFARVADCARVARTPPEEWARGIVTDIARRLIRRREEREERGD
jgi:hypothetical protein